MRMEGAHSVHGRHKKGVQILALRTKEPLGRTRLDWRIILK
jgi:hypothetical protein